MPDLALCFRLSGTLSDDVSKLPLPRSFVFAAAALLASRFDRSSAQHWSQDLVAAFTSEMFRVGRKRAINGLCMFLESRCTGDGCNDIQDVRAGLRSSHFMSNILMF